MTVAPGTAFSAASLAFVAALPVSSVSPGPCVIFAGSIFGAWFDVPVDVGAGRR